MKRISQILEETPDNVAVEVHLKGESTFELSNFEIVDTQIYNQHDIYLADIEKIITTKNNAFSVGNKIEFSISDVVEIKILEKPDSKK